MRTARRGHRVTPATTWAAVLGALAVHATLLATTHALGVSIVGETGFAHVTKDKDKLAMAPELEPSCSGDAFLALAGRATLCLAPWEGDPDGCLHTAQTTLWIELSSCQARDEKGVAEVAMLEPKQVAKIKPIDPEPLLAMMKPPPKPEQPKPVPPPQPQQQPPPPPPAPPAPPKPMQIVETAKPTEQKPPENTRFLAEYDSSVEKQKVARGSVQEPMVAKSKPSELEPTEHPKEASIKEQDPDRPPGRDRKAPDVPGTLSMRNPGAQARAEVEQDQKTRGSLGGATGPLALDGYSPRRGDGAIEQQQHDRSEQPRGQNGAGGGQPQVPNLKPTQELLERALGGGNVDHLDDVDNGDETALNAKRWLYASFFNRMKRQVAQNWDPQSVWRRIDPTGQVNGYKTRVTELRVSLSPRGELVRVVVTAPSGVSDLDDEAVRAFHAAAPFPNTPKELVGRDDLVTFAFSFYFEIGGAHTSWRVIHGM